MAHKLCASFVCICFCLAKAFGAKHRYFFHHQNTQKKKKHNKPFQVFWSVLILLNQYHFKQPSERLHVFLALSFSLSLKCECCFQWNNKEKAYFPHSVQRSDIAEFLKHNVLFQTKIKRNFVCTLQRFYYEKFMKKNFFFWIEKFHLEKKLKIIFFFFK